MKRTFREAALRNWISTLIILSFAFVASAKTKFLEEATVRQVSEKYQTLVRATYADLLVKNKALDLEARELAKNPNQAQLEKTRAAWKEARLAYSPTEPYRYYGGPIDNADVGVEALMNAWPIDESYLDAVKGSEHAGLIMNEKEFPVVDAKTLSDANEKGGEKNVSTGYHAIEFLLWGQDFSLEAAGNRPATDFTAAAPGGVRRAQALTALTGLLVTHTEKLVNAWQPESAYSKAWNNAKPDEILRRILVGATSLSADEMAGERMTVALEKNDPEHEQDCFSDFSLEDLKANQRGIMRVLQETGLLDVMAKVDSKRALSLRRDLDQAQKNLEAIPAPFDRLISNPKSPDRKKVQKAIAGLQKQARSMNGFAKMWGVELNVQGE